jgi:putative PIN family toxin of toxin-antitoxin system
MTRVVLDTNVFISGILSSKNPPGKILKLISSGHFQLIASEAIIREIEKVLYYPKIIKFIEKRGRSHADAFEIFENLIKLAVITPGKIKISAIEKDPSDNIFLSAGVEGRADFIVSGDAHLTDLGNYRDVRIINPSEFIKIISEESYA